jgi:hypothetical protein
MSTTALLGTERVKKTSNFNANVTKSTGYKRLMCNKINFVSQFEVEIPNSTNLLYLYKAGILNLQLHTLLLFFLTDCIHLYTMPTASICIMNILLISENILVNVISKKSKATPLYAMKALGGRREGPTHS